MKNFLSKYSPSSIFWNVLAALALTVPIIFSLEIFAFLQAIAAFVCFIIYSLDSDFNKAGKNNFWLYFSALYIVMSIAFFIIALVEISIKAFNNWLNGLFIKK